MNTNYTTEEKTRWLQNILILSLIIIPLTPSYLLWLLDFVAEGNVLPDLVVKPYLSLLLIGLYSVMAFAAWKGWNDRLSMLFIGSFSVKTFYSLITLLLVVFLVITALALFMPLYANDPTQYAMVARIAMETGGFSFYPMENAAQLNGFVVYMTHPLGYPSNILAHWSVGLGGNEFGFAKIISVWFGIASAILLLGATPTLDISYRLIGVLFLMLTPLYGYQVVTHGVDPAVIACAVALALVLGRGLRTRLDLVLAAALLGFLVFSHSLGIVIGALLMFSYILFGAGKISRRIVYSVACGISGLVMGGYQYFDNFITYGSLLSDQTPVWDIEQLARNEYLEVRNSMVDLPGKVIHGLLMPFTRITFYGLTAWFALLLLPFAVRSWQQSSILRLSISFILLYWGLVIVLVAAGNDAPIRGSRYFLPLLPFLSIIIMYGLQGLLASRHVGRLPHRLEIHGGKLLIMLLSIQFAPVALAVAARADTPLYDLVYGDQRRFDMKAKDPSTLNYLLSRAAKVSRQDDNLLLTFRMDQLAYYTKARFIRYLDRRLIPFYQADSMPDALRVLRALGITHVFIPNYSLAAMENSWIRSIMGNPSYAEVIARNLHGSLYKLHRNAPDLMPMSELPYCRPWQEVGRRQEEGLQPVPCDTMITLKNGRYQVNIPVDQGGNMALSWTWRGKAQARVAVQQMGADRKIADMEVVLSRGNRGFSDQFNILPGTEAVTISLLLNTESPIEISPLRAIR